MTPTFETTHFCYHVSNGEKIDIFQLIYGSYIYFISPKTHYFVCACCSRPPMSDILLIPQDCASSNHPLSLLTVTSLYFPPAIIHLPYTILALHIINYYNDALQCDALHFENHLNTVFYFLLQTPDNRFNITSAVYTATPET